MLEARERGEEITVSQILYFFFKGLKVIMAKRARHTGCSRERHYRNKRRRYTSLSPTRGESNDIDIKNHIESLEMNIDILRAQLVLLRKEVEDLRQRPARGQKHGKSACSIM